MHCNFGSNPIMSTEELYYEFPWSIWGEWDIVSSPLVREDLIRDINMALFIFNGIEVI